MQLDLNGDSQPLFQVRVRAMNRVPDDPDTLFSDLFSSDPDVADVLKVDSAAKEVFKVRANAVASVQTVVDLVHATNEYFRDLRGMLVRLGEDQVARLGVPGDDVLGATRAQWTADNFVQVTIDVGGVVKWEISQRFARNFYIDFTAYGDFVFASGSYIAFKQTATGFFTGEAGVIKGTDPNPNHVVAAGAVSSQVVTGGYPLSRNFDLRVALEVEGPGMRIPAQVKWLTSNKQSVKFSIASFPVAPQFRTVISLDNMGRPLRNTEFQSTLFIGNHVFRRAEDKVKERYLITNPRFYQNIRLTLDIERRRVLYDPINDKMVLENIRAPMKFPPNGYWSAKLRFRTIN